MQTATARSDLQSDPTAEAKAIYDQIDAGMAMMAALALEADKYRHHYTPDRRQTARIFANCLPVSGLDRS